MVAGRELALTHARVERFHLGANELELGHELFNFVGQPPHLRSHVNAAVSAAIGGQIVP